MAKIFTLRNKRRKKKHGCSTEHDGADKGNEFCVNFLCNNLAVLDEIPFQQWDILIWPFSVAKHFHGGKLAANFQAL